MLFAICNLLATILYILLLKDISNLSKQEVKNLYKPKKHRIMGDASEYSESSQKKLLEKGLESEEGDQLKLDLKSTARGFGHE